MKLPAFRTRHLALLTLISYPGAMYLTLYFRGMELWPYFWIALGVGVAGAISMAVLAWKGMAKDPW